MNMGSQKEILNFLKVEDLDVEEEEEEEALNSLPEPCFEEDPLLADSKRNFIGEFNENGFLAFNDVDVDEVIAHVPVKKGPGRPKKIRLSAESVKVKARNGYCWSTAKSVINDAVVVVKQKCKGPSRVVEDPLQAWCLLVDEPILTEIVKATNEEIKSRKKTNGCEKNTNLVELRAFLGLCYLCGVYRHTPELCGSLDELWTLELGNTVFRATMSKKRFEFLSECLRFRADQADKVVRQRTLAPIELIWNKFIVNCRSYYAPSTHCNIDEHIMSTTDRTCPYQHKLPTDAEERGLRLISLCDAKTLYICNVYIADNAQAKESDVLHLVGDIKRTRRNVLLSERYTTMNLVQRLGEYDVTAVGLLPLGSEDLPPDFINGTHTRLYSDKITLIKSGKQALLTSTPTILNVQELYECTQVNGQRSYKLAKAYSTSNSTLSDAPRWPLQLFHVLLDYAALNAWILLRLSEKANCNIAQRDFQRMLGLHLTMPHLRERLHRTNNNLTINLKLQICEMLGEPTEKLLNEASSQALLSAKNGTINEGNLKVPENITLISKHHNSRARCKGCPKPNQNKTKMRCQQCARVMCSRHLIYRCSDCTGVTIPESLDAEDPYLEV